MNPKFGCPSCECEEYGICPVNLITAKYCVVCSNCGYHYAKEKAIGVSSTTVVRETLLDYLLT